MQHSLVSLHWPCPPSHCDGLSKRRAWDMSIALMHFNVVYEDLICWLGSKYTAAHHDQPRVFTSINHICKSPPMPGHLPVDTDQAFGPQPKVSCSLGISNALWTMFSGGTNMIITQGWLITSMISERSSPGRRRIAITWLFLDSFFISSLACSFVISSGTFARASKGRIMH